MTYNYPQETLKNQLKKLKQYIQDNNIQIYECSEQTIGSFLSNLGFINIHTKQGITHNSKKGQTRQFFHEAGLTLTMEFDSLFVSDPNHLTNSLLCFIGDRLSVDFYTQCINSYSNGTNKEKVNIYGFPMEKRDMVSHPDTQNDFISDLESSAHYFNLYQQPIQGMELYFANSIRLIESWEAIEQLQQDKLSCEVIQNYIGKHNLEQIKINQETESNNLIVPSWLDVQAGHNNHFSIRAMDDEMENGFLGHLKNCLYINSQNYYELSHSEKRFLEQAYLLTTGQKKCQAIDPEWFDFQINNSINFLNIVASVHQFDSTTETIFQQVLAYTETYYDKSTVRELLFHDSYHLNTHKSKTNQQFIERLERLDNNQSQFVVDNLLEHPNEYLPYVFKSLDSLLDYMKPQDLFEPIKDSQQFETTEKLSMLECFVKKIKQFNKLNLSEYESIKYNFLDHLTEKLYQSQTTIDYFKQFNQKTADDSKEQQIKDYMNNKMQNLILNQNLNQEQTPINKINKKRQKIVL